VTRLRDARTSLFTRGRGRKSARFFSGGVALVVAALGVVLAGCGNETPAPAKRLSISSPAFHDNGKIPARFTCKGAGKRPPLKWSHVPDGTNSLAVVVTDPGATPHPYVHLIVTGLQPSASGLPSGKLPPKAMPGPNSAGKKGWTPPCPPAGSPHDYEFTVYALGHPTHLKKHDDPLDAVNKISGAGEASATITGHFTR
jgi:Raf kinase inhibitor-like YbhB/YbcL family protein